MNYLWIIGQPPQVPSFLTPTVSIVFQIIIQILVSPLCSLLLVLAMHTRCILDAVTVVVVVLVQGGQV